MPQCFVCSHGVNQGQLVPDGQGHEVCDQCGFRREQPHPKPVVAWEAVRGQATTRRDAAKRLATLMGWDSRPIALLRLARRPMTADEMNAVCERLEAAMEPS